MNERSVALFIHLLGVVSLFIAIGMVQRLGTKIRSTSSVEELRLWLGLVRTTAPMFPVAALVILASGLYMAARSFSFETPWIVVAIGAVVVMMILGGTLLRRGMAAMGKEAGSAGSFTPELARAVANPTPWGVLGLNSGMSMGLLWIMVNKPGWAQSIGVVVVLGVIGAVAAVAATKSKR